MSPNTVEPLLICHPILGLAVGRVEGCRRPLAPTAARRCPRRLVDSPLTAMPTFEWRSAQNLAYYVLGETNLDRHAFLEVVHVVLYPSSKKQFGESCDSVFGSSKDATIVFEDGQEE